MFKSNFGMQKLIKRWGSSLVITINKEDIAINGFHEGDLVEVKLRKLKKKVENDRKGD